MELITDKQDIPIVENSTNNTVKPCEKCRDNLASDSITIILPIDSADIVIADLCEQCYSEYLDANSQGEDWVTIYCMNLIKSQIDYLDLEISKLDAELEKIRE